MQTYGKLLAEILKRKLTHVTPEINGAKTTSTLYARHRDHRPNTTIGFGTCYASYALFIISSFSTLADFLAGSQQKKNNLSF